MLGAWYEKEKKFDDKGNEIKLPPGSTCKLNVIDRPGVESGWDGKFRELCLGALQGAQKVI